MSTRGFARDVSRAVESGGDAYTNRAMAGAVACGCFGASAIPVRRVDAVAKGNKGRHYIVAMAERFCDILRMPVQLEHI